MCLGGAELSLVHATSVCEVRWRENFSSPDSARITVWDVALIEREPKRTKYEPIGVSTYRGIQDVGTTTSESRFKGGDMKQATYFKVKQAFTKLRKNNSEILNFSNFKQMLAEVEDLQQEVSGSPDGWWITRRSKEEPFQPGNVRLIEIRGDSDLDYLIHPSY